ncbi:hypothetical protein [Alkaliphilus peptidifermentans]|uniref:Uncharacterized protein n=1 Tax=Alkaliphilus peptidifermentans DSM 18978 TaxID=1120976 RepID=A0A1G5AAG3_9FIRM|nr:hypothetical protein [Alkaliphilus peptidifermentans]SCX74863.1 hypothetical protein SAMN03080606_00003 [Alkaliphilus peptidifermentans DSM 18978]
MAGLDQKARHVLEFCNSQQLDILLLLQTIGFKRISIDSIKRMQSMAASLGEQYYVRHYHPDNTLSQELLRLGIKNITSFSEKQEHSLKARAFYNANSCTISINDSALDELYTILCQYGMVYYSRYDLKNTHLLHELFHHIEEKYEQPVNLVMEKMLNHPVSAGFRDIAAFAFVNYAIRPNICQILDFIWLCYKYPRAITSLYDRFCSIE